jgi:hypothetical protein
MQYWNGQLFSYCERALNGAFWAEPFNAISNAAFWIAAVAALAYWLRTSKDGRHWVDLVLIALLFIIGTGSFLFHTYATRWAVLADVFPIIAFMLLYLGCAAKRFLGWNWLATLLGVAVFFVILQQAEKIHCGSGPCLNGSIGYIPAFAVLVIIGGMLYASAHPAGRSLIAAGLIFGASLVFRTFDRTICDATDIGLTNGPVGTHFVWHTLNALLLFLLIRASIRHGPFTAAVHRDSPL